MTKRALVLSPFSTEPRDAGQRRRAFQSTQALRELGYRITFLLYAFEDGWKTRYNEPLAEALRAQWDEVIVLPAGPRVGLPPMSGTTHTVDEWWDDALGVYLTAVFKHRSYLTFVVHNVWLSKALDFAPLATVKVIETHDVFSLRRQTFDRLGKAGEFFMPTESEEIFGLNRADIVVSIQPVENDWLAGRIAAKAVCLPYTPLEAGDFELPESTAYRYPDKVVFGFLGSRHAFNVLGLKAFLEVLKAKVGATDAPVEIRIGGRVGEAIEGRGPFVICGYVENEAEFFRQVDFAIVPIFDGSGFKIKTADALGLGKPILMASHAAIGLRAEDGMVAASPEALAEMCVAIALERPPLSPYLAAARRTLRELQYRAVRGTVDLGRAIAGVRTVIVYDLRGLDEREAAAVLLSWSGALHIFRGHASQVIVGGGAWLAGLMDRMPVGVSVAGEAEAAALAGSVRLWITVGLRPLDRLKARPASVVVDTVWAEALGHTLDAAAAAMVKAAVEAALEAAAPEPGPRPEDGPRAMVVDRPAYWHNLSWDHLVAPILQMSQDCAGANGEIGAAASIYLMTPGRSKRLAPLLSRLYDRTAVVARNGSEVLLSLSAAILGKRVRRVVTDADGGTADIKVMRALSLAMGIEFVGLDEGGVLDDGTEVDARARAMYHAYEHRCREMLSRNARAPAPK